MAEELYGLLAEFDSPDAVMSAAEAAYTAGYRKMDAYTPIPVEGLVEAMGKRKTRLPLLVLIGGLTGTSGGYALQYWAMDLSYPLNIGGRPMNSWPVFIPVCFELTILCAALTTVISLFFLNKFPMPYHPVFNVPRFAAASKDGFFLCIESNDKQFELDKTRKFLEKSKPKGIYEVEP